MIPFAEVVDRALSGPICSPRDFDLELFVPTLREVVTNYDISYDPNHPVPSDDDLADRVWGAAFDLFLRVGTYCPDTERIIKFSQDEIEEALRQPAVEPILGEGQEAKRFRLREPESDIFPWCSLGAGGGAVSSEEIFTSYTKACAEFPLTDSITTPSLVSVDGRTIVAGSPWELEGAIRTVVLAKEAMRRARRPGLPIVNGVATAVKAVAHIGGHTAGLSPSDALEIGSIAELRVDLDSLNKVCYALSTGCHILAENGPILGGLCGGPPGTAVVAAAYNLLDLLVLRGCMQHPFAIHFDLRCTTSRELLWIRSVSNQAVTRNSPLGVLNLGYVAAGPMTEMCLYETAAWVIASVVSGGSIEAEGVASNIEVDYRTPLESIFAGEVAHAAAGMSRQQADEVVAQVVAKYEDRLAQPPKGVRYQDCFDLPSGRAKPEYIALYAKVRKELEDLGLEFKREPYYR